MMAVLVTPGAMSLSVCSHFSPIAYQIGEAGHVAAGPRQTVDEPGADRIGNIHEQRRDGAGCFLHRGQHLRGGGMMTSVTGQQLCTRRAGGRVAGPPNDNRSDVAALDPTELREAGRATRRRRLRLRDRSRRAIYDADPPDLAGLLRVHGERRRRLGA